jgi:NAD(P)-dependent dehydrogenase (short-subunit alcohol dehydrogenase family)
MTSQYATYPSLRDKVVFITGGGSGIGASLVEHFSAQRAKVHFVDMNRDASHALVEQIASQGLQAPAFDYCDVCDIKQLQTIIRAVAGREQAIHALVNNAANDERHATADVTVEYWESRMHVNLRHQFFAAQAAFPFMQQAGGGSIVNMGSASWHKGQGGMPGYTSSKAAIEGLTRSLARDLGQYKIRVNCIIPGWIMTERQKSLWLTPEAEKALLDGQCLKEKLYPEDVARMALWLAAEDSRMCTSQNYVVDAGWL